MAAKPQIDLIDGLVKLLEQARTGELQAMAYVGIYSNGDYYTDCPGDAKVLTLMGGINVLRRDLEDAIIKKEED